MSLETRREEPTPPEQGDGLSSRPLRSDRRLALGLLLVGLSLAGTYLWAWLASGGPSAGPSLLQYAVLSGLVLVIVAVVFYLARYLIRLLSERRAGILGSRFKFKLVVTFVGLCLVPAIALYFVAIVILWAAVDRALSPDVERMVRDAQSVERQFYDDHQHELATDLHDMAATLAAAGPLLPETAPSRLRPLLDRDRMGIARVWFRGSGQSVEVVTASMADKESPLDAVPEADVVRLWRGTHFERPERIGSKIYLIAGSSIPDPVSGTPSVALLVARKVPADLAGKVDSLMEQSRRHEEFKAQAPWIKSEQGLILLALTLVVFLGAFWVGVYVARGITVPIARLVEATREVRRGNLSHVVTWSGTDELAELVAAFNDMARDLGVKEGEVSGKTSQLQDANLELERVNEELEQRRSHMEMLLQTMSLGVIAVDAEGVVSVANQAVHEILELPPGSRSGQHVSEFLPGEALVELRAEMAQALRRKSLRRDRATSVRLGRGEVHLQVVLSAQPDSSGGPGLLALIEDVTELVRAQKLATWRAAARRIAHEIKNPLTPIQLSAQRILKKFREGAPDLPQVLEAGVGTIIAEVSGLKQMVDEFSDFARMPEVRPVPADAAAMLESVRALYEGHEGLRLSLEVAPDMPAVPFDPELLRRAVVNLVDNAVEATDGRGRIWMRASVPQDGGTLRIEVADDGPGILAADRDRLFLPYFTTRREGTGLGLAIVHRIVADHGGRVRVEDNLPRGARFVMELPAEGPPRSEPSARADADARRAQAGRA